MSAPLKPCGTVAAYRRHLRHGETPCDACKEADYSRSRKPGGKPFQPARHGTRSKYTSGCRCGECTAANRESQRADRAARAALPPEKVPHGLNGYRNYGCRCVTCGGANNAENRAYRARLRAKTGVS